MSRIKLLFMLLTCLTAISVGNWFFAEWLQQYALIPRRPERLPGIIVSPFLHADIQHLIGNLTGLLIFGWLLLIRSARLFLTGSVVVILLGGLLVWLFARPSIHIGASGWVFGLWSLNIALAWFDRKFINILIAIAVVVIYGGMIWGVLPQRPGVSFEFHLAGAIAGLVAARLLAGRYRDPVR